MDVLRGEETGVPTQQSKTCDYDIKAISISLVLNQTTITSVLKGSSTGEKFRCGLFCSRDALKVALQQIFCVHVNNDFYTAEHTDV